MVLLPIWAQLPPTLAWWNWRGHMALEGRQPAEAARCWTAATALAPSDPALWYNLGLAQYSQGLVQDSVASYQRSLALAPQRAATHKALGDSWVDLGQPDQALASYDRAHRLDPAWADPLNEMANVYKARGELGRAIRLWQEVLASHPEAQYIHSNLLFSMALDPAQTLDDFWRAYQGYSQQLEGPQGPVARPPRRWTPGARRIRVGYVSPDFRTHAVANFIEPILRHADRSQFELFAYQCHERPDAVTQRLMGLVDHWRPCAHWSDTQLAEVIRIDGIDVLLDLAGHTAGNRMPVFALRPAPVQLTFLGYPGSSGLLAMDGRITDVLSDPPGAEAWYREPLLRLPDSLFCYQPLGDVPPHRGAPCAERGHVTFACFASYSKVNDAALQLWACILRAVPSAQMRMLTVPPGQVQDQLRARFAELGVDPARLTLLPKLPRPDYLAQMHEADIALDPIAINSPTTLCETLWMGLPVVSLYGQRCATRAGLSVLSAAGLGHLAVPDEDAYVATAVALAQDPARLVQDRLDCRTRLATSPLMDGPRFVAHLEGLYREALLAAPT